MARRIPLALLSVVAALLCAVLLSGLWLDLRGTRTTGTVTGRHERIALQHGGQWERECTVDYRFRPEAAAGEQSASHRVACPLYHRLREGARVSVRYLRWPLLDSYSSALVDAPFTTRMRVVPPSSSVSNAEAMVFALACALAFVAYRLRSWTLGGVAAVPIAIFLSASLLLGFIVLPLLVVVWRRLPGRGIGWVLALAAVGSVALLWWRMPAPPALPDGPLVETTATVRQVQRVEDIFGGWRKHGENLRTPFDMVELEFAPPGAPEPVHAVDFVDAGSVANLRPDTRLPIAYASADPGAARIQGARRDAMPQAFRDIVVLTLVFGALAYGLGWLLNRAGRGLDRFTQSARSVGAGRAQQLLSRLPADDPRRRQLEERLRAQGIDPGGGSPHGGDDAADPGSRR